MVMPLLGRFLGDKGREEDEEVEKKIHSKHHGTIHVTIVLMDRACSGLQRI